MRRLSILGVFSTSMMLVLAGNAPALGTPAAATGKAGFELTGSHLRALALNGNRAALRVLAAPVTSCAGAEEPDAGIAAQETAMQCMINYARTQAGLPKLDGIRKLDNSASNKGADILRCNQFSHEACGRDFLHWFRRSGYLTGRCWWAGENLAWGTESLGTARSVARAWLHSPSHRANILGRQYAQFGISLRVGGLSGNPDVHVWVNHFGRRC